MAASLLIIENAEAAIKGKASKHLFMESVSNG